MKSKRQGGDYIENLLLLVFLVSLEKQWNLNILFIASQLVQSETAALQKLHKIFCKTNFG